MDYSEIDIKPYSFTLVAINKLCVNVKKICEMMKENNFFAHKWKNIKFYKRKEKKFFMTNFESWDLLSHTKFNYSCALNVNN